MNIKDFGLPLEQGMNAFFKDLHDTLKKKFKGRIKPGFLVKMEDIIRHTLPPDMLIGDIPFTQDGKIMTEKLMSGFEKRNPLYATVYSYCRLIVAIHSSKFAFESDEMLRKNEKSQDYQHNLGLDVLKAFWVRNYSGFTFDRNQLYAGDEFVFFPVPYYCSVMTGRMLEVLRNKCNMDNPYFSIYDNLVCKSLSVQTLLQDGHFDGAYTIERSMIEIYIKLYAMKIFPECISEYYKFVNFEYDRTCGNDTLKEKMDVEYNNRFFKSDNNRTGFMHYGWVEYLPDYNKYIDTRPYTFASLNSYVESVCLEEDSEHIRLLNYFYGLCHGYTHGEVTMIVYPYLHYMEISYILALLIPTLYKWICVEYDTDTKIGEIDVLKELADNFEILKKQYNERSTDKYEAYYKRMRELSA